MKTTTEQPSRKFNLRGLFIMICTTLASTLSFGRARNLPLKKQALTLPVKKLTLGFASLLTLIAAAAFFRGNIEQWSKKSDEKKKAEQQVNNVFVGQTCEGQFTITATRSYDPNTNKTTYTYLICQTGAKNALSHWGFPIELCPGETLTIQQILAGSVAQTSLDGITWTNASAGYGKDPSTNPQCTSGDVFKFDEGMGNETCRYYRLIVNGSFTLIPISGYIKYGPHCCNYTLNNGGCLEEICIPPSATFTGPDNVCPGSTNTYTGPAGNDTYTWTITAGTATIVGSNTNQSVNVMAGPTCGTYTLSLSTTKDDCPNSSSQTFNIVDAAPPVFTGSYADVNLACNPDNPAGSLGSATATDVCGAVTVTSSDGDVVTDGCNRSQTRTFTATDGCNNTATTSRTARWTADLTPPVFTTTPASVDLDCLAAIPSVVTPTASDACGTTTITMTGSTDDPADCTTGFKRIITRTWIAIDACGNTATYTQTIRVKCCETVCTLTQGAYGNPGGNICLPNGTTVNQTQIMIDALTAASGNMVVFGRQDLNRYWVIRLSDVNQGDNSNIFNMLPGGGPSQAFDQDNVDGVPEYDNAPSWPIAPLETGGPNAGQIRNQLFSQTLTLYFNTTIAGSTLANVNLDGSWAVLAPRNCGSSEPAGAGTPTQLVSPAISSYLATHGYATTVAGLLQLANDALGGVDVSPLTLSQIQEAVANINEVFDECRILTGYVPAGGGSGRVITSNSTSSQPSLIVTAFPNPYVENFSLRINSPVTGQAMISFYTMDGVKVGEMKRDVVANRDVLVPYNVPAVYRTRIVYTVTVGGYHARGLVLSPN